jgi:hypothetical protein
VGLPAFKLAELPVVKARRMARFVLQRLFIAVLTVLGLAVTRPAAAEQIQVVHIKAHMFAYSPEEIVVKKASPSRSN